MDFPKHFCKISDVLHLPFFQQMEVWTWTLKKSAKVLGSSRKLTEKRVAETGEKVDNSQLPRNT